nr:methyltransferase domain-containing protein [Acidobacteriota bacterium]
DDESVDVALLSQALHHASDPARAITEAARIVVPGGHVLLLDLREHHETWVRERLGDRWTGFSEEKLRGLLHDAGLEQIKVTVGARRTGDPFTVLIASGLKPTTVDQASRPAARATASRTKATKATRSTKKETRNS